MCDCIGYVVSISSLWCVCVVYLRKCCTSHVCQCERQRERERVCVCRIFGAVKGRGWESYLAIQ